MKIKPTFLSLPSGDLSFRCRRAAVSAACRGMLQTDLDLFGMAGTGDQLGFLSDMTLAYRNTRSDGETPNLARRLESASEHTILT